MDAILQLFLRTYGSFFILSNNLRFIFIITNENICIIVIGTCIFVPITVTTRYVNKLLGFCDKI